MSDTLVTADSAPPSDAQVQGQDVSVTDAQGNNEPTAVAPDKYDFKFPDGFDVDANDLNEYQSIFKEAKLPQELAQKLVDKYTKAVQKIEDDRVKGWENLQEQWANNSKSDKEYGGLKFDENVSVARKAVEQFGTPELKEMLDVTGTGNHPEMLRFMYRVGKAISEDMMRTGQSKPEMPKDVAHRLYPGMQ